MALSSSNNTFSDLLTAASNMAESIPRLESCSCLMLKSQHPQSIPVRQTTRTRCICAYNADACVLPLIPRGWRQWWCVKVLCSVVWIRGEVCVCVRVSKCESLFFLFSVSSLRHVDSQIPHERQHSTQNNTNRARPRKNWFEKQTTYGTLRCGSKREAGWPVEDGNILWTGSETNLALLFTHGHNFTNLYC